MATDGLAGKLEREREEQSIWLTMPCQASTLKISLGDHNQNSTELTVPWFHAEDQLRIPLRETRKIHFTHRGFSKGPQGDLQFFTLFL